MNERMLNEKILFTYIRTIIINIVVRYFSFFLWFVTLFTNCEKFCLNNNNNNEGNVSLEINVYNFSNLLSIAKTGNNE